ncbi:MAG: endonuclease/exonuclease/phosphatase family protein [Ignavibacteriales bacterium]|nr:endonuclease/exonuclease/phosphatase family protein [Ignavibacteriales bacterium]
MLKRPIWIFFLIPLALLLFSCSTTQQATQTEAPPSTAPIPKKPDIILRVATLNLANLQKRIEKKDIERFAKLLKQEQVDILGLQGIARYPSVKSRTDIVDELAVQAEMRSAFGETINNSGRQNGNGVFSTYPIRSHANMPYEGIKSANFESALSVTVDGGVKDIIIVSTLLPEKSAPEELSACIKTVLQTKRSLPDTPFIVMGNLPESENIRKLGPFFEVVETTGNNVKRGGLRIWYENNRLLKLLNSKTIETNFGPMVTAQFGLFQNAQP